MTEVSLFGGRVFRRIGEAEGVGVLIVVFGDVRIGYLGPIGNDAPCGKLGGEGAGILSDLAGKREAIVLVVDDDPNLVPVLPGEGGGTGAGIVDGGAGGGGVGAGVAGAGLEVAGFEVAGGGARQPDIDRYMFCPGCGLVDGGLVVFGPIVHGLLGKDFSRAGSERCREE